MLNIIEKWKIIEEFPQYFVSNKGRVKNQKEHILHSWTQNSGYSCVTLYSSKGIKKNLLVHRLVAKAFIPCSDLTLDQINHIDGDKQNNTVSNLEWVTASKNMLHAYKESLRVYTYPTKGKKLCRQGKKPTSSYHGVCWDNSRKKWCSGVPYNKKRLCQKRFNTEIEAAEHYNQAVISLGLQDVLPLNIIKCPTTSLNDVNPSGLKREEPY